MNCRNCQTKLNKTDDYCNSCGAKVIRERITVKNLFLSLIVALGWDSNFFITLRHLVYKPQVVFKEYIGGTRKKYANPFTFFAISLAISLFVYNQFSEEFYRLSAATDTMVNENVKPVNEQKNRKELHEILGFESKQKLFEGITKSQIKYYNIYNFLILPIYTLIAFLVFRSHTIMESI